MTTRVAVLTYDHTALFELGCAVELFALPRPEYENWYRCEAVAFSAGPFTLLAGLQLQARVIRKLDAYDMLVVPSWPTAGVEVPPPLANAIRKFHAAGKRIISFCSGAFLLARLGLLDGRKATTHWRYAQKFKQEFPAVDYVDDVLYVYDGRMGCSAGSAAAIDLGIEVIRQDHGWQVANQVARRLVMSAHRKGGQSQFVETPVHAAPNHFADALDWAMKHLAKHIDIDTLARKASMSRRTFDRKFRSTFNLTPHLWLVTQRINLARELLEKDGNPIERVAARAGFDNATTMRHHFRKVVGVTPTEYRQQFRDRKRAVSR
jgi:AraC family transcriptional regulator, transcriptional activator FtrA